MKKYVHMKRKELSFEVGEWMLVKLQPYRQHSIFLQKLGQIAYKLPLP